MATRPRAAALPTGAARKPVLLLALGSFALGTDAFVIGGVLPEVGASLRVGLGLAGLLITVFSAVYAVGAPVLTVLTGNFERRKVLLTALAVFTAGNVLAALADSYGVMVVARVLSALGAALYTPAATATAASLAAPEERGRALATVLGGLTLATALGVPLGTLIANISQWRMTFVLVALLGAAALIGLGTSLTATPPSAVASLRERLATATVRTVPSTLVTTALTICGVFTLLTYLTWFVDRSSGITGAMVTVVYLVYGLGALISNTTAGMLIDHVSPRKVAAVSAIGLAAVFGALAVFAHAGDEGSHTGSRTVLLFVLIAAWALVGWMFIPAQQQRLLHSTGPQASVALSLNASAIYVGQALGGALGGALLGQGTTALPLAAAACVLISSAVLLATRARRGGAAAAADGPSPVPAAGSVAEQGRS
ncbi:MFS transporter [Streptomyces sp. NPDC047117]|uniref:MFS transporter n=1 Tax=Streptomyces sp. NPDC047117 TaxID=3155379 RepID=UPI0033CDAD10